MKSNACKQHVAELGVADARLAVFHARADAFLGDHLVDGKMLADVAQKIEERNARRPLALSTSRAGFCLVSKSSSLASCTFTLAMLWSRISCVSNWRSCGLAAGIANGAGRAAGHGNGMMAEQLKPAQREQRHQIADVQAVRRRDRSRSKA